jgi:N-methylhydantoinase B/oxoprolinase/acetone carboxylase alpha subunit
MPADSRSLAEEGVLIPPTLLVRAGRFEEERLRAILTTAPHPARNPADNLAELEAMARTAGRACRLLAESTVDSWRDIAPSRAGGGPRARAPAPGAHRSMTAGRRHAVW